MARNAPGLARAVQDSLREAKVPPRGRALAVLAQHYAEQLDRAFADVSGDVDPVKALADLGPKLQASLAALGLTLATPAGGRVESGASDTSGDGVAKDQPADVLAALRAERERRAG